MTKPILLTREARKELRAAAHWYCRKGTALRLAFLASVDEALRRLARLAPFLALVPGVDPALRAKRIFVRRFPYAVVFLDLPEHFSVLAIAHNRRRPGYWVARTGTDEPEPGGEA
jgi:toxin ParE1/3/4